MTPILHDSDWIYTEFRVCDGGGAAHWQLYLKDNGAETGHKDHKQQLVAKL